MSNTSDSSNRSNTTDKSFKAGGFDCVSLISRASSERIGLAVFSGIIALADNEVTKRSAPAVIELGATPSQLHEVILQSYLFCGFPRMLEALFNLAEVFPEREYLAESADSAVDLGSLGYSKVESKRFETAGSELIRRVYGKNYSKLESAITEMSPEVFRLMVIEGYGKTLSRAGLDSVTRELATVAALTVDGRARQLKAHLLGSLNVGASVEQVSEVLSLVGEFAAVANVEMAKTLLGEVRV